MRERQLLSVHAVGEERLRMERVGHIDAFPKLIEGKEDDVARPGIDPDQFEHVRQPDAGPFRDERPSFLARLVGDLRVRGIAFQIAAAAKN